MLFALATLAHADELEGYVFTINEENDKFVVPSTDKHYTQGLHFTLMWPDEQVPWLARPLSWMPTLGFSNAIAKYGFTVGQNIYTPANLNTSQLITNDRPYAGWLYLGWIRENRGTIGAGIPTLDHWEADLGVVGPASLAYSTQYWFHGLINVGEPEGWGHELHNEPGIALRFNRSCILWQTDPSEEFQAQFIPHLGANLGNIDTSANLGAILRVGYQIPDDFGKRVRPHWGWYVFGGPEANAVARNEFLAGNVLGSSHHVQENPAFVRLQVGIVIELKNVELGYTYNYLTPQFEKQTQYDAYGSLNFTYRF
jgi:hypothetical protein